MPEHTPGPWEYDWTDDCVCLPDPTAPTICSMPLEADEEQIANGHLIAAAPDLLEACKSMMAFLKDWYAVDFDEAEKMKSAIAKATGSKE